MRVVDIWFSALLVLLIPTRSSVALATAKSSGLFGVPAGGSTATKSSSSPTTTTTTTIQAASIGGATAEAPATVSSSSVSDSASEVCACI